MLGEFIYCKMMLSDDKTSEGSTFRQEAIEISKMKKVKMCSCPKEIEQEVTYVKGMLNLIAVHAGHAIGKHMDIIVILQQIQGRLKHTHVGLCIHTRAKEE